MTITKRPPAQKPQTVDAFISGAPDAVAPESARKGVMRGKREQISHTMPPELLAKVDQEAASKGITRAGFINIAISEYLKG
jgi:hypothetical protein